MHHFLFSFVVAFCLGAHCAVAALTSGEIANSLNELAQQGFAAKQLVLEINSTGDAGPITVGGASRVGGLTAYNSVQDVYTEIDTMVTVVLSNVNFMSNTPIINGQPEQQEVYEGYSNVGR